MTMKVLVTGGAGFIGSNFVRMVLRERPGWTVVNLDALTYAGNLESLTEIEDDPRHRFVHGDVTDQRLVSDLAQECDAIVHLAAESHVDRSIADPRLCAQTNTLGTQTVLEAVRARPGGSCRVVHVSTDEVYGSLPLEACGQRFSEASPLRPNSPYSASKAAADLMCRAYAQTFGIDVVVTRCSNNFGPYQFPDKIIPLFVTNLIERKPVPLYGDGLHVRDWLHVEDHCRALLAVLEHGRGGEIYNIGAGNEHSNLDLTRLILEIMGKGDEMIEHVDDRPGHDRRYAIDAAKISGELGWKPEQSGWPEALAATVEWYTQNPQWWRHVRSGRYRQYTASGVRP